MSVMRFSVQVFALTWIATLLVCCSAIIIHDGASGQITAKLTHATTNDLVLLFVGDTQYYFPCTETNGACKQQSLSYRIANGLNKPNDCHLSRGDAAKRGLSEHQRDAIMWKCIKIEGTYVNNLQSEVMKGLVAAMPAHVPRALIINGDLVNTGREVELEQFEKQWLQFPRVYPNLGNHDYENYVNKCKHNHCASRMLRWLMRYQKKYSMPGDYTAIQKHSKTAFTGSFAYAKVLCSKTGGNCATLLHLNNRITYTNHFKSGHGIWHITTSAPWLRNELIKAKARGHPIFINLHNLDAGSRNIIVQHLKAVGITQRVFVLFAHDHRKHGSSHHCAINKVPFIYVGSVPNLRYSVIKLAFNDPSGADLFFMSANADGTTSVIKFEHETLQKC